MRRVKMCNFAKFLGAYLFALFALVAAVVSLSSCRHVGGYNNSYDSSDSTYVASIVQATNDPVFTSVDEVVLFQNRAIDEDIINDLFLSLPEPILQNVATVVAKHSSVFTKKDVITEYRQHRDVYDSLYETPDSTLTDSANTTAVEGQQTPVVVSEGAIANLDPISVEYHYEIDTINGKPTKVLIKEEKYESK